MMKNLGTQILTTDRLLLRRFTVDDVDAMFEHYASDPQVTKFLKWPAYTDKAPLLEYLTGVVVSYDSDDTYLWAIELVAHSTLIGSIVAKGGHDDIEMKEVGYSFGRPWWGQGYATEALGVVIRFLFDEVGVNRVEAVHDPENPASGRVMAKSGMRQEGVLRAREHTNQGIRDAVMWAILAGD